MSTPPRRIRHTIPGIVPLALRRQMYAMHPGRARRWRVFPGIERVRQSDIVLTFDDGPGRDATPLVLEELAKAGIRATFFVLGRHVLSEPGLTRDLVARGHDVALHGFDHLRYDKLTFEGAMRDLERGVSAIEKVTGLRPRWFRPPFGRLSRPSSRACRSLDLRLAYWSASGVDWEDLSPEDIARGVRSEMRGGAIVLLHDTALFGRRDNAIATARAIGPIARYGADRGWSWRPLSEAMPDTR